MVARTFFLLAAAAFMAVAISADRLQTMRLHRDGVNNMNLHVPSMRIKVESFSFNDCGRYFILPL